MNYLMLCINGPYCLQYYTKHFIILHINFIFGHLLLYNLENINKFSKYISNESLLGNYIILFVQLFKYLLLDIFVSGNLDKYLYGLFLNILNNGIY